MAIKEKEDVVNHPKHYCRDGGMESIDEMITVFGVEAVKNFCLCNVWKYRYRAADKNGEEDLKKSDWYMKKYKELCVLQQPVITLPTPPAILNPDPSYNPNPYYSPIVTCESKND